MDFPVPFSKPYVPKLAHQHINKSLESEIHQGDGLFSRMVEEKIRPIYPGYEVFLTPSCTAAIEMSLMLYDVGSGDEVILPSFNFTSMATAITKFSATPVFCDIDFTTGCLDVNMVKELITPRTRVISWVNYAGLGVPSEELKNIAQEKGIALLEDAAHNFGILTEHQKELTGDCVVFSFHATKNFQCGEGGALLVRDSELIEKAHVIREKGTNRRAFKENKVSKYNWVGKGSSYLLAEINCALLYAQLEDFELITQERRRLITEYKSSLRELYDMGWHFLEGTEKASHIFAIIAPDNSTRDSLLSELQHMGVMATSHYEDLSTSPAGIEFGKKTDNEMINSISLSKRIVRLPLYVGLNDHFQKVVDAIRRINLT